MALPVLRQQTFKSEEPTLYLVGTPIGNLEDWSFRAQAVLQDVGVIFCEDTRTTAKLLQHYGIRKPLVSCHQFNESARLETLLKFFQTHSKIALVSDAGVPTISDPGAFLVAKIREQRSFQINITAVNVGPAYLHALVVSGYQSLNHYFHGFLKNRGEEAKKRELKMIFKNQHNNVVILYESVHRLEKTLILLAELLVPETPILVARELTKVNEELIQGQLKDVVNFVRSGKLILKGEFVILIDHQTAINQNWTDQQIKAKIQKFLDRGINLKTSLEIVSELTNHPKNQLYQLFLSNKV